MRGLRIPRRYSRRIMTSSAAVALHGYTLQRIPERARCKRTWIEWMHVARRQLRRLTWPEHDISTRSNWILCRVPGRIQGRRSRSMSRIRRASTCTWGFTTKKLSITAAAATILVPSTCTARQRQEPFTAIIKRLFHSPRPRRRPYIHRLSLTIMTPPNPTLPHHLNIIIFLIIRKLKHIRNPTYRTNRIPKTPSPSRRVLIQLRNHPTHTLILQSRTFTLSVLKRSSSRNMPSRWRS